MIEVRYPCDTCGRDFATEQDVRADGSFVYGTPHCAMCITAGVVQVDHYRIDADNAAQLLPLMQLDSVPYLPIVMDLVCTLADGGDIEWYRNIDQNITNTETSS